MRAFENVSREGNEKAIRRGRVVPKGDVNLAYIRAPELSPQENIIIVDTSRVIEENVSNVGQGCKLYYANAMGILVDDNDNTVVADEFPAITDIFSIDEDFNTNPGNEYTIDSILPYRHVSRYFHLDYAGLTITSEEMNYDSEHIRVVDNRGVEYDNYRTHIVAAYLPGSNNTGDTWGYRVFVYIDTDSNEDLYLTYNKVEIDENGALVNRDLNHKEILNPEPFFDYIPEESDVVDPDNRRAKIYSTKPLTFKDRILGKLDNGVDGYKVYVPKKAIPDPRIYQLFRWRIKCTFKQEWVEDPITSLESIKCGVIVTNKDLGRSRPSFAPYAFYNLQRSSFNITNVAFNNPHQTNHSITNKRKRSYWFVNIDKEDLSDYDILIWAPPTSTLNYSKYSAKIGDFISKTGGTLFFDTTNYTDIYNQLGGVISRPVSPSSPRPRWSTNYTGNPSNVISKAADSVIFNNSHTLIDGDKKLGGWKLGTETIDIPSYSYYQYSEGSRETLYSHAISTTPRGHSNVMGFKTYGGHNYHSVLTSKMFGNGHRIISTMGTLLTCSMEISYIDGKIINTNYGRSTASQSSTYFHNINGAYVEGAMKLLYNAMLLSVRNKIIDNTDESAHSTTWEYTTPWKSSWVIDPDVLSDAEKAEHDFQVPEPKDLQAGITEPISKRQLSNKTVKELVDEALQPLKNNPQTANRIDGSTREYEIEVTNPYVKTGSVVIENFPPKAYTEASSPAFVVPVELGPHIIREEVDEEGRRGRVPQYDHDTKTKRSYPDLPYAGRVSVTYAASEEYNLSSGTNYTGRGTADVTVRITTTTPPRTEVTTSDVEMSWWDAHVESASNPGAPLNPNGSAWRVHLGFPDYGMVKPNGIADWQDANYKSNAWGPGNLCWAYWGMNVKLNTGSSGDPVRFVQEALNRFQGAQYFGTSVGILRVDGHYGLRTKQAVRDLQTTMQARYIDGVVDAESWFIIGAQINRLASNGKLGRVDSDYTRYFGWAHRMQMHRLSDGNNESKAFSKRSWISGGPSIIWELFAITFDKSYNWHGVTVVPYLEGATQNMMVRSVHVTNQRSLSNYDSRWGQLIYMPHRPGNGNELKVPFGPYGGDTLIVGVGQDRSSGWGTSRMFGIRDIRGHTRVTDTTTIPGTTVITYQTYPYNFTRSGSVDVTSFRPKVVQLQPPSFSSFHSASNVRWTSITTDNPEVVATITRSGRATFETSLIETAITEGKITRGPVFPNFTYYSMDETGRFNPVRETGYVSRAEGVKLLCDKNKRPVGFPALPTDTGANEAQRHYMTLALSTEGTAQEVTMSFYDNKQKEFVTNIAGEPEMSYLEYVRRGPQNIYIAVVSEYELTEEEVVPVDDDAPRLPFKWAMPVYGVCSKKGARITLEPLPPRLGPKDVWPIAVREGKFTRQSKIRSRAEGRLTGWVSGYQGSVLESFYALPEAALGGYSTNFGPPNSDVVNEEPRIIDDNVIQVRQAPILMVTHPTEFPNPADPFRPVFDFYKRDTINAPWVKQPLTEIEDYNVSTGEIFLKNNLQSNDESLLRVDYTTKRRSYYFKSYEDQILNLNSYSGHTRSLIGEAIYVYIVPHYVKDPNGDVIPESVHERTLQMTLNPNIFNPLDPEYNPLAIQLGIVYQSTALDLDDVAVIDTRKRGGGVRDGIKMQEVERLINEAATYWDTGYATGSSYQKSGYLVVRLPEELKNDFSEQRIRDTIERNITSGVAFKIEDLSGKEWA